MAQQISLKKADLWNDDELVKGWDEAQAEYKQYHSIKDKRPEEVLSKHELLELFSEYDDVMDDVVEDVSSEKLESQREVNEETAPPEEPAASGHQEVTGTPETSDALPAAAPTAALPQAVLGSVTDEKLKNLMMSWYYAGYYTGLYQGQQEGPPKSES